MSKQTEALKLALQALEYISSHYMSLPKIGCMALAVVEEALAEPAQQQEPVAWRWTESNGRHWFDWRTDWTHHDRAKAMGFAIEYAYTSPPASKPWVELTELEALGAYEAEQQGRWGDHVRGLLAVEAKLREKNA